MSWEPVILSRRGDSGSQAPSTEVQVLRPLISRPRWPSALRICLGQPEPFQKGNEDSCLHRLGGVGNPSPVPDLD